MKYLYFSAPWCGPCKQLAPKMDLVAEQVTVEKILVDEDSETTQQFNVRNVPTVVLVSENGTELERFVGVNPAEFYLEKYNTYVN
jgi:thioredoxin-like negative regulator of GroEL